MKWVICYSNGTYDPFICHDDRSLESVGSVDANLTGDVIKDDFYWLRVVVNWWCSNLMFNALASSKIETEYASSTHARKKLSH